MKFSEIKPKIKNLGNFKSLKEIKKAGLRIVYNRKDDSYWLIEKEFLKPVIKSPRECKSILVKPEDLKYKVFMCHKSKKELKGTKALEYIKWGEKQGYHKRPTCVSRPRWWDLGRRKISEIICMMSINDRHIWWKNEISVVDARLYDVFLKNEGKFDNDNIIISLNSSLTPLFIELGARANLGEGVLDFKVYEASEVFLVILKKLKSSEKYLQQFFHREIKSIFEELGFDKNKPIREQEPSPLPDRKALDDIVFDALGLTEQERKEVYWTVAELVKNRLEKAKSV